jgi:hypothetical protein
LIKAIISISSGQPVTSDFEPQARAARCSGSCVSIALRFVSMTLATALVSSGAISPSATREATTPRDRVAWVAVSISGSGNVGTILGGLCAEARNSVQTGGRHVTALEQLSDQSTIFVLTIQNID